MRERGYSAEAVREAARGGRLAFGYTEDLFRVPEGRYTPEQVAVPVQLTDALRQRAQHLGKPVGPRFVVHFVVLCHGYLEGRRHPRSSSCKCCR